MSEEVEHFVTSYPPPSPPSLSPDEIFNHRDFRDIDNRARQAPDDLINDFDGLVSYLLKGVTSDLAKVRSIFVWLSNQPVLNTDFPKVVKPGTPRAWLKMIKYDRNYYAELFAMLCRKSDVPCVIIEGASKGAGFEVGQKGQLSMTNRWNAVHVQGGWQLVNVPWAFVTTDGMEDGSWITVEEDGVAVREVDVSRKQVTQELDEFWFLTKPEDFSAFCHPTLPAWQLLEAPWTDEEFINTPRFAEELFSSQWELVTENKGVLVAKQGTCKIAFMHPSKDIHSASLKYKLFFNTKQSPKPLPETLQLTQYAVVTSKKSEKSIVTRLPQAGVYRVQLGGILNDDLTPLGEFRIECHDIKKEPPPFPMPEGCDEVGYTEKTERAGLVEPSHEEGIVEARPGDKHDFSFKFAKNKPQPRDVRATVTHNTLSADKLRNCAKVKRTDDDVTVSVTLPKDKNNEFGVCIDVLDDASSRDGDNKSEQIDYHNVINYIVTHDKKLACADEKAIIKAKNDFLDSIKNWDIARFYQLYTAMGDNMDPMMRAKAAAFIKEIQKIKHEKMQDLVQAMNGTEINLLEKALADFAPLAGDMNENTTVRLGRATLDVLRALKSEHCGHEQVQMLEKALGTFYELSVIRNSNVQRAEDALVTYYEKDLGEAFYKRKVEALATALATIDQTCVKERVKGQFMFAKVKDLQEHLKEMKQVTDKVGRLKAKDLKKIAGDPRKEPHPHVQSVLMATFILLGEKEADLWNWGTIQNLLERRAETGVARAMADLDLDALTDKQVTLAESHVRACNLDVLRAEDLNSALFLQWVQGIVNEKRGRDAVRQHHTQTKLGNN